ncbi:hypothetical protein E3P99_01525 [Wallemia hederae]|uniref:Mitochondrial import inner membrane translocase subunit TIM16 n=1 Tax=Wallemia hederae TaxID=1540922 RepID=A0A4T0FQ40_9BASI|nr:hypothetical protein E3P99_01525 [Wallemia hederae]
MVRKQITFGASKAFGKAFMEMGRQAVANATYKPDLNEPTENSKDKGGSSQANPSQQATKQLKMTLDEAHLILNVKREASLEEIKENYDHLFKVNSPPQPKVEDGKAEAQPKKPQRRSHAAKVKPETQPYSHYLQSKVVRAFERIQAEQSSRIEAEKAGETVEAAEAAETDNKTENASPESSTQSKSNEKTKEQ